MNTRNAVMTSRVGVLSTCLLSACLLLSGCGLEKTPPVTVKIKPAEEGAAAAAGPSESTTAAPTEAAAGGVGGDLTGVVLFDGTPPTLPPLVGMGSDVKDKAVCSAVEVPDESLVVDPTTKGIHNVFVFFEKAPKGAAPIPPPEKQIYDQKGCKFIPHAMIVRTKVPLLIMSDDSIGHNTHTLPNRNKPTNDGIKPNERKGVPISYAQTERTPFKVVCDVHPWMGGYHLPLDHGYAALTNEKGEFVIKGLPAGEHTLVVWHEGGKPQLLERSLKVTIPAKEPLTLKFAAAKFGK